MLKVRIAFPAIGLAAGDQAAGRARDLVPVGVQEDDPQLVLALGLRRWTSSPTTSARCGWRSGNVRPPMRVMPPPSTWNFWPGWVSAEFARNA